MEESKVISEIKSVLAEKHVVEKYKFKFPIVVRKNYYCYSVGYDGCTIVDPRNLTVYYPFDMLNESVINKLITELKK
jgi:hypothetical protein